MIRVIFTTILYLQCWMCCCFAKSHPHSHVESLNVWPKPVKLWWAHPKATILSADFTIKCPRNHPHLVAATDRYQILIKSEHHVPLVNPEVVVSTSCHLKVLQIKVADLTASLQHGVDESYNLTIPASGAGTAVLAAKTVWGAMRGLETFSQLVWVGGTQFQRLLIPVGLDIWDSPIFAHRGLLLDTSRNYYGVKDILRTISAMSWNKLNVFHWHITDSHSFPLLLPSDPDLAIKGSYGPFMQYTPADVAEIIQFGFDHGVRVIPEIDSPAHTGSWAGAHPEIVTCAGMFWWPAESEWADRLASEPGSGQLNPLHPKTYQVMKKVIKDIVSLFPDPFYHSGGDEVIPGCWTTDPIIQAFLSNYSSAHNGLSHLLQIFINSTLPYVTSHNKTSIYWEDVLLDSTIKVEDLSTLPPEHTILQTWNGGSQNTKRIVSSGYRTIVSSADYYYLDCGHGSFVGNDSQYNRPPGTDQGNGGSWCGPFKTWQLIYNYDITYGLTQEEKKLVLGGEVALWSEQADPTVLDSRLWPRASALAEALWSGNRDDTGKKRYAEATDRLNEWRYRMVRRGVRAEPIQPLWCARNPGMCNTVHASG
ncbi:beta-hexosaminidase 2-like [Chenopodium quinoa]|uniref:Beta-hexosaminidase n=1 Tax=Chenopodium quinoa TaxID=63459 RepID=A0A803LBY1_CHEQI|nr:beta-hexosaminidase 2-like [Chenopodium quinoa]